MNYKKIILFLKEYNYFIAENDWERSAKDHPDFPQLNAIADLFNQYGIDNYLAQVPFELLDELSDSFIGIVNYNNQLESAIIKKVGLDQISLTFFDSNSIIDKSEFLNIWNGYILVLEENEKPPIVQPITTSNTNLFTIAILSFLFLATIGLNTHFSFLNFVSISLLLVNGFGLFLSFLAVRESLGFGNRYLFKVCSTIKNGNCNQVIRSNNAELFFGISYSDLSFVFFIVSFVTTFFIKNYPELFSFNIIFLPVSLVTIFFTLYQQKFVLKKWCLLCLGISLAVIIQSIMIVLFSGFLNTIDFYYLLLVTFFIVSVLAIWYFIKPQFLNLSDLIFEKYQRGEIYKDKQVFNLYLEKNILIPESDFQSLVPIQLNYAETANTITLILSPNCDYCKYEYSKFKNILFYYENKINFRVIFDFDITEVEAEVVQLIESLYSMNNDIQKTTNALDDFLLKNLTVNKWLKKWKSNSDEFRSSIIRNNELLFENNITDAPCLLINNRLYPKEYKIEDIKYFLNGIINME